MISHSFRLPAPLRTILVATAPIALAVLSAITLGGCDTERHAASLDAVRGGLAADVSALPPDASLRDPLRFGTDAAATPDTEYLIIPVPAPGTADTDASRPSPAPWMVGRVVTGADDARTSVAPEHRRPFDLPLTGTTLTGRVDGMLADLTVTQQYRNPASAPIEVTYIFPLSHRAAVRDFIMTMGDRTIRGVVRERAEAERLYDRAVAAGHTASMMRQEQPNLFTQKIGNIPAHAEIDITLTYLDRPTYQDGWLELTAPLAADPRYRPDAVRPPGTPTVSAPTVRRDPAPVHLDVLVDALAPVQAFEVSHPAIDVQAADSMHARFRSPAAGLIPDRDLRLRWRLGTDAPQAIATSHWDAGGGWLMAHLVPPSLEALATAPPRPRSVVLLLDVSGSMKGPKLQALRTAAAGVLDGLRPEDRFELIAFSRTTRTFQGRLVAADPARRDAAIRWMASLEAGGGTDLQPALKAARRRAARGRRTTDRSVILLTDALHTEEQDLVHVASDWGEVHLHAIGLGDAPNRSLVARLARIGGGLATFVTPSHDARHQGRTFLARASAPVLRDVTLDDPSGTLRDVVLPDGDLLAAGRPVVLLARYDLPGARRIHLTGRAADGSRQRFPIDVELADRAGSEAIPVAWARARIADLEREWAAAGSDHDRKRELNRRIRETALVHGIVSRLTSFVAVDAASRTGQAPTIRTTIGPASSRDVGPSSVGTQATDEHGAPVWWTRDG